MVSYTYMIRLVVFDFDGTIADSFGVILAAFTQIVPREEELTQQEIDVLRNKPYKDILDYFGISMFKVPGLVIKGRQVLKRSINHIEPFDDMQEVLRQLKTDGYILCIISSNATQNIEKFLRRHELQDCFDVVKGNVGLLGKPKVIRGLAKQLKCAKNEVVYIGDEPRDVDAAKRAGVASIAVTWGFSGEKILTKHNPTRIVHKPQKLAITIQDISEDSP